MTNNTNSNNSFGLFIANSNFNFKVEWIKNIDNYLFVNTTNEELIVFKRESDELIKKYILLTNGQVRDKILDVFIVDLLPNLIKIGKKVIITISEKFNLNFWNLKDGLCISQVNLAKILLDKRPLIYLSIINKRFIVFFFKEQIIIFDSITHLIIQQQKLDFSLVQVYHIKENKYFLYSEKNITYLFQFKEKEINNLFSRKQSIQDSTDSKNAVNKIFTNIKNLQDYENLKSIQENSKQATETNNINTKSSDVNIGSIGNSYLEKKESFNFSHSETEIEINFQYDKFFLSIQKSNFLIQSLFEGEGASPIILPKSEISTNNILNNYNNFNLYSFNNDFSDSHFITFDNGNYIFHTQSNNTLNISYYNQFEEINVASSLPLESKFSVVFMNKFTAKKDLVEKDIKINDTLLFVVFKDLSLVIYKFNSMINQLDKVTKFFLMVEDEYINMKFLMLKNLLIGHLEEFIFIFDFDNLNYNKEEKYVDSTVELNNLFNKKNNPLHFSNYFKDNFKNKYQYYINSIIMKSHNSPNSEMKILHKSDNVTNHQQKNSDCKSELHVSNLNRDSANKQKEKNKKTFQVTASTILSDPDNISVYYIFGTNIGKIAILDIFFDESLNINPIFLLNYHNSKINFLMIFDQKYLLSASEDGVISITDICKSTIERAIERYKTESFRDSITKKKRDSQTNDVNSNSTESKEHEIPKINRLINHSKTFISLDSGKSMPLVKKSSKDPILNSQLNKGEYFQDKDRDLTSNFMRSMKNYNFNGFFSRRKSFKNEENKAHITIDKILDIHEDDCAHNKKSEDLKFINLLPILTIKNYYKLKKILPVNFVDLDANNQEKQKFFYSIILEDNSALVINLELMKIVYNFNINYNKTEIKGVYLKHNQNILMFYLSDGTLKTCNYTNKMGDRDIIEPEMIFKLLRVEEKLKCLFCDPNQYSNNNNQSQNSNNIYMNSTGGIIYNKDHIENYIIEIFNTVFDFEEFKKYSDENSKKSLSNKNIYSMGKLAPGSYGVAYENGSHNKKINEEIRMEFILGKLQIEEEKTIFLQKYIFNLFSSKKLALNFSQNKFEAYILKKVEGLILDRVYEIVNQINIPPLSKRDNVQIGDNNTCKYISESKNIFSNHINLNNSNFEKVKKIEIFNLINNPNKFTKLNEKSNLKIQGVDSMLLLVGNQSLECLDFYIDEFVQYIDRKVEKCKNAQQIISQKINYLNFISLFRIWNLSVDQDSNILNFLKIFQPIFDFSFILKGENNSLTMQLNQEFETDGYLNEHFEFFKEYIQSNEDKKRVFKDDKYFDKKYLISYQKGYLVNFKNFKISSHISHLMNLCFYSCLISILGFQESTLISKLIISEKNLTRNLMQKKYIKFTNFFSIFKFYSEEYDDVSLANKDLILFDFLCDKHNKNISRKLTEILCYLTHKHKYLFKDEQDSSAQFYKLNKEKNIDSKKLNLLDQYDLFLINLIITYDSCFPDQLNKEDILKATQLMILLIFKFLRCEETKSKYSKIIVEILSKSVGNLEIIYKENTFNYAKFLIDLYTFIKVPIDLDGLFKKYDLDICTIIKSDSKFNFLKIMLAKQIKYFAKSKVSTLIYLIGEEFKKKNYEFNYYSHLLEILWLLLREKNPKYVQYLPLIVNLIVTNISPQNKEMKNVCLEYSKKILANLISYYPMIAIDPQSQKLAVGANDGKIYIYDLSTGSFWKNLNAHQSEITALIFDNTGNIIVSYSSTELNVKFWKIGLTNFLSNFFSSKNGYYQIQNLEALPQHYDEKQKIDTVKFQIMPKGDNTILLIREDHSSKIMKL